MGRSPHSPELWLLIYRKVPKKFLIEVLGYPRSTVYSYIARSESIIEKFREGMTRFKEAKK